MKNRPWIVPFVLARLLGAQAATDPGSVIRDPNADAGQRCAALAALQTQAALDVPTVLAAMADGDEALAAAATAIVRHEWTVLPDDLLAGLDARPIAARRFLLELAAAPRPSAHAWIAAWLGASARRTNDDRCLAFAARGAPLAAAEGDLLLRTLAAGEAGDGVRAAVPLVPEAVADAMVGRLHALLERQPDAIDDVGPLLDRLSAAGCRQLLGFVVTLPDALARALCQRIAERDPASLRERARAMLDGETPFEALWLDHAAPLLDRPERTARVLAVLADETKDETLRQRAFDALLAARVIDEPVLAFAKAEPTRLQRLLAQAVDAVPGPRLVEWLAADPATSSATVVALTHRAPLGAEVEQALVAALIAAEWNEGRFFVAAALALAQHGSEAALDAVWPKIRGAVGWSELVDALGRRREPFVHELLVAELDAPAADGESIERHEERRDAVRLALVALGDRRQLAELVVHAKDRSPSFVRRCTHFARPLAATHAATLLDAAAATTDPDLATELLGWASTAVDASIAERLWQVWEAPAETLEAEARREVALRTLAAGPFRARLIDELQQAIASGPIPARLEPLSFELVASMPSPLSQIDARFLADLVLRPPLTDPALEQQQRTRWPDGRFGFPLVAAIAQRLRGTDVALLRATFAVSTRDVRADPRHPTMARQRLLVLWRSLEAEAEVMMAVAQPTAPLLLALPDADGTGEGPAHFFSMQVAEAAGDFAVAVVHARAAIAGLLRLPTERRSARLFLGERQPASARDPWAALATAPHRLAHRAALARGDTTAAAAAAALVREFAGHDAETLASLSVTNQDPHR